MRPFDYSLASMFLPTRLFDAKDSDWEKGSWNEAAEQCAKESCGRTVYFAVQPLTNQDCLEILVPAGAPSNESRSSTTADTRGGTS